MPSTGALFTVDLEPAWASTTLPETWGKPNHCVRDVLQPLLRQLERNKVKGVFYVLGYVAQNYPFITGHITDHGHLIGSHGMWHRHNEREGDSSDQLARKHLGSDIYGYRSPYWDNTRCPGISGGTWFRLLPARFIASQVRSSGTLWVHPHDLSRDPQDRYWRHKLFIGNPWEKLEYLLREVDWRDPRE